MVTTTRADWPVSPFAVSGFLASPKNAKPRRTTCSRKPLSSAGMSPSQSGKKNTMCSAHLIARCASAKPGGNTPCSHSIGLRNMGKSSVATSMRWMVCPAPLHLRPEHRRLPTHGTNDAGWYRNGLESQVCVCSCCTSIRTNGLIRSVHLSAGQPDGSTWIRLECSSRRPAPCVCQKRRYLCFNLPAQGQ